MLQGIHVTRGASGSTYFIPSSPASLPPVLLRDLLAAWESARQAALAGGVPPMPRAFRFALPDGGMTDLALSDADAQCWAYAIDQLLDLSSFYGLSVCLRLLALIDLLASTPWAQSRIMLHRGTAELDPALLRLAASAKLTDEAGFDGEALRRGLAGPIVQTSPA